MSCLHHRGAGWSTDGHRHPAAVMAAVQTAPPHHSALTLPLTSLSHTHTHTDDTVIICQWFYGCELVHPTNNGDNILGYRCSPPIHGVQWPNSWSQFVTTSRGHWRVTNMAHDITHGTIKDELSSLVDIPPISSTPPSHPEIWITHNFSIPAFNFY